MDPSPLATTTAPERQSVLSFATLDECCDYWDLETARRAFAKPVFSLKITADPPVAGKRLHAAVYPLLQDAGCVEEVRYVGFGRLDDKTRCFSFSGWCPVHKRSHEDHTWFQLQCHPEKDSSWWKCFRDGTSKRVFEVALLKYL